ncbi:MAG: lamin tail domain-containing protein [Candidatus Hodarchaeales archaeon]|jgi:hypothetical protein
MKPTRNLILILLFTIFIIFSIQPLQVDSQDTSTIELCDQYGSPANFQLFNKVSARVQGGNGNSIVINEFLPNPSELYSEEWIELYNPLDVDVDISGFFLDDIKSSGSSPYIIPSGTIIDAKSFLVFHQRTTEIGLDNANDTCNYIDPDGVTVIDSKSYTSSAEDVSYGRMTDAGSTWTTFNTPTLGASNIITGNQSGYDRHVVEVFYFALGVLFALPFITMYFIPKTYTRSLTRKGLGRLVVLDAIFLVGFFVIELLSNPDNPIPIIPDRPLLQPNTPEFFIFSSLWLVAYLLRFLPHFLNLLQQSIVHELDSDITYQQLEKIVEQTIIKLRGSRLEHLESQPGILLFKVPGSYYLNFIVSGVIGERNPDTKRNTITFTFIHSARNLNMLKILSLVLFEIIIIARSEWTLTPDIIGYIVDAEIFFTLLVFAFILFNLLIAYTCENLVIQRETAHRTSLLDLKMNFSQSSLEEIKQRAKEKLGIQTTKPSIEEIKQKAREKVDLSIKKAEQEKKERIDKIIGTADSKVNKAINPEIIRLEALIRETKKILNATPEASSIDLEKVVDMLGGTDRTSTEEIEQIVIGLVTKKEVRGEYNIWKKSYSGGNTKSRFVNRTLRSLDIKKEEIASLKVSGDEMEVTFREQEGEKKSKTTGKKKKLAD